MPIWEQTIEKALRGERLGLEDGILLFEADLSALSIAATRIRDQRHADRNISFIIDRNIYYTNVCVADCDFCAFYRRPGDAEGYVLSNQEIYDKIAELVAVGGTTVLIQGGINPNLRLDYYCDLIRGIKERFPKICVHSFSAVEIDLLARIEKMSTLDTLLALKEAGLDSVPGAGAEMLIDRVRDIISPKKMNAQGWLDFFADVNRAGLKGTATMVFGHVETREERVIHLLKLRELQDQTNVFRAFITWSMSTQGTPGLSHIKQAGGEDYLRTLAISRLMLDNFENIQSGWVTEGHKIAQLALEFGANDMGGTLMEELVIEPTGLDHHRRTNAEVLVDLIDRAGYKAVQRTTSYQMIREYS